MVVQSLGNGVQGGLEGISKMCWIEKNGPSRP